VEDESGAGTGGCDAPYWAADPVTVLPEQREALEHLIRTHSTPQQLALRARIIVQAADGMGVRASSRELGIWPKTVRYCCKRWRKATDRQSLAERLADAPRSGAPATYTLEQICALVAMACEKPSESERPIILVRKLLRRRLRQQEGVAHQNRTVHRLLQPNHGQTLPLDHGSKTSHRLTQMSHSFPLGCTSHQPYERSDAIQVVTSRRVTNDAVFPFSVGLDGNGCFASGFVIDRARHHPMTTPST
jgi:putative transposase